MPYIPHTDEQRKQMLATIGAGSIDALFEDIPPELRVDGLDLPAGLTERQVREKLAAIQAGHACPVASFVGGGVYDHYVPSAVDDLSMRSEFYTAYTPYQPEASQGTLQAIYEYQTMVARLTGLDVANASLYDGGSALYEAVAMACRSTRRERVVLDETVNPVHRAMLATYTADLGLEIVTVAHQAGRADPAALAEAIDKNTAAVVTANPNYFGICQDVSALGEAAHAAKALLIVSCYPISLGLLKPPGAMGADIAIAEGQSLGLGLNFGGPYLGLMACTKKLMRKMPGRVAGRTLDADGREGFVLTLQAREQHIRREKATSNICTNQGLCALRATMYLSLLGKRGLVDLARRCADNAAALRDALTGIDGVTLAFPDAPVFNELAIRLPRPAGGVVETLAGAGIAAGIPLGTFYPELDNALLVACTEKTTAGDIDLLTESLRNAL